MLSPLLRCNFREALKQVQQEQPIYRGGAEDWWKDVIRRTALGAGADPKGASHSGLLWIQLGTFICG